MLGVFYQHEDAAQALETVSASRIDTGILTNPIALCDKSATNTGFTTTSSSSAGGTAWRVTSATEDDSIEEEVVFTVHGIVFQCDLPPIVQSYGKSTSPRHLQQKVVITGLGTPTFTKALNGLARIDSLLRLNIRDTPKELATDLGGYPTLTIANRFFTSKKIAKEEEHVGFTDDIDPKGILEAFRGDTLVHTTENEVFYYRRNLLQTGEHHFSKIQPANIKAGDVIEVQFTVTLVESTNKNTARKPNCITKLILRSITLLDDTFSENARLAQVLMPAPNRRTLKRKVGHDEEESREAEHRLKRMAIDPTQGNGSYNQPTQS
ncbi:hypothetical protein VNI00_017715 [Paramarasmius palmivorus]|uniref:Uncharacterized protein n=1 Tax=Paramarasmius palmivorus TaxID=297713 RepID=A0AAW0B5V1_9AGAR